MNPLIGVNASLLYILASLCTFAGEMPGDLSVETTGAKGDGLVDDTAAIQRSLDAAAKSGGRVLLSPRRYLVKGSLSIPPGVTLQGVMDSPVWSEPLKGSVILAARLQFRHRPNQRCSAQRVAARHHYREQRRAGRTNSE